jgi:hypothetical protein
MSTIFLYEDGHGRVVDESRFSFYLEKQFGKD